MNFMEKFNELANRTLVPVADKLANQRHLAAIRDGMVVAIPLSILGGACLIVSAPTTSAVPANLITGGKSATDLLALAGSYIPTTYLDAKGIFTAIIVSIGCVEIMNFLFKKNVRIKMPEGVPPAISSSFDAILPLFICVIIFYTEYQWSAITKYDYDSTCACGIWSRFISRYLFNYYYCSDILVLWFTWCKYHSANQITIHADVFNY